MIADCCFPVCRPGHGEGVPVQALLHSLGQGTEGERGKGDLSSLLWDKQLTTSWFIAWCISSLQGERRTKRWWRPVARSHTPWCAPPSQGAFLLRTWNVTLFAKLKAEDELNAAEGFERIFPTSETYFYFEYFADLEEPVPYSERLMDAYENKFGNDRAAGRQLLESYCQRGAHLLWLLSLDSVVPEQCAHDKRDLHAAVYLYWSHIPYQGINLRAQSCLWNLNKLCD